MVKIKSLSANALNAPWSNLIDPTIFWRDSIDKYLSSWGADNPFLSAKAEGGVFCHVKSREPLIGDLAAWLKAR